MRKAEAEVRRTQDMEVSLLVKSFFEAGHTAWVNTKVIR